MGDKKELKDLFNQTIYQYTDNTEAVKIFLERANASGYINLKKVIWMGMMFEPVKSVTEGVELPEVDMPKLEYELKTKSLLKLI